MGKVMEQLRIADAMANKVILKPALNGGVQLVAAGQAEIGIYPASEVTGVKGLTIVGPLPAEINLEFVYGAAVTTDSAAPDAASHSGRGALRASLEPSRRITADLACALSERLSLLARPRAMCRGARTFAGQRGVMGVGRTQANFTFALIAVVLRSLAFRIAAAG
jgi:Bacterial extracellular solute-binding protein